MALPLPARVKAVLFVLARRIKDKNPRCWSSLSRLAADSGNSERSTSRALRYLADNELIEISRATGRVAHYKVNLAVARLASQGRQIGVLNRSLNRKPWTMPCSRCGIVMRSTKRKAEAICRSCSQSLKAERDAPTADVIALFPEAKR